MILAGDPRTEVPQVASLAKRSADPSGGRRQGRQAGRNRGRRATLIGGARLEAVTPGPPMPGTAPCGGPPPTTAPPPAPPRGLLSPPTPPRPSAAPARPD